MTRHTVNDLISACGPVLMALRAAEPFEDAPQYNPDFHIVASITVREAFALRDAMLIAERELAAPAVDRETLGRAGYEAFVVRPEALSWSAQPETRRESWRKAADAILAAAGRQAVDVEKIRSVIEALRRLDHDSSPLTKCLWADTLESALAPAQSGVEKDKPC